ncbi:MAG TPA: winged helix-turn-helix domain-containing protein [Thermoanaerobaculia bacterium]
MNGGHLAGKPPRVARFGVYEVDLRAGEVHRHGVKLKLQEQPFRLLIYLLERAGDVVTREELQQRLWPSEFVDFDHSLNAAIRKLREALDDSAEHPRFIETMARRGYRFIAPVSWNTGEAPARPPAIRRTLPLLSIVAAAVLIIGAAAAYWANHRVPTTQPNTIDAVVVLPFINEDRDTEHLSDGLTEILIDSLSRIPHLRVMARTTAFRYKGKSVDPQEVGRALNVSAVVVGHLRHERDRYAIHVELIDVRDGTQLWGNQFESTAASLSTVQTRIAEELSDELQQGVGRDRRRIASSPRTTDPEAYDLYLKGLYAWNRRGRDDLAHALEYFQGAIDRDPNFAAAYAGLAQTYGVMVGYGLLPVAEGVPKIITAAEKALHLDPNNASALVSLATTKYRNVWDFSGAERDYRRALTLNPNYATGHQWYADLLRSTGRWAEARQHTDLAYKLDPFSPPIRAAMCYSLYYERRYQQAIAFSRHASELDPRFRAPSCEASSLMILGDTDEALSVLKSAPGSARIPKLGFSETRHTGRKEFFKQGVKFLIAQQSAANIEMPVAIAAMYAQIGNNDAAFAWLEKAYDKRISRITDVNVDPLFDPLHSDPRFDDLLRRIGLPRVKPPA